MPVTAKLSRKFYERFGDDVANELVDWFNAVDATYRSDLDRLNEVNFERFDANVGQRFAAADARLERRLADLREELRSELSSVRHGLMRWMFVFWATTMLAISSLHLG